MEQKLPNNKRVRKEFNKIKAKEKDDCSRKLYEVRVRSNGYGFSDEAKKIIDNNTKESVLNQSTKLNARKCSIYSKITEILNKYKIVKLTGLDKNIIKTISTAEKVKRLANNKALKQCTEIYEVPNNLTNSKDETTSDSLVPAISITLDIKS